MNGKRMTENQEELMRRKAIRRCVVGLLLAIFLIGFSAHERAFAADSDSDYLKQTQQEKADEAAAMKFQAEEARKARLDNDREFKRLDKWYRKPLAERLEICRKKMGKKYACDNDWQP